MGIQDRDYYREELKKKLNKDFFEEKQQLRIRVKPLQLLPKKESFKGLLIRALLVLAGCWAIIEVGLKLKV